MGWSFNLRDTSTAFLCSWCSFLGEDNHVLSSLSLSLSLSEALSWLIALRWYLPSLPPVHSPLLLSLPPFPPLPPHHHRCHYLHYLFIIIRLLCVKLLAGKCFSVIIIMVIILFTTTLLQGKTYYDFCQRQSSLQLLLFSFHQKYHYYYCQPHDKGTFISLMTVTHT